MINITGLAAALLLVLGAAEISARLGYPRIIGQLIGSLLLGIPFLQQLLFNPATLDIVDFLAQFGLIFLLLLIGFELNTKTLRQSSKSSAAIALTAAVIPFASGFVLGKILGWDTITNLILGASLAVTAEGTKAAILFELGKIKTKIGSIMLEAGIFDDVFEILFLTAILILSHENSGEKLILFPLKIIFFIAIAWTTFRFLPKFFKRIKKNVIMSSLNLVIIVGLVLAVASELAGLGAIIGALLAGMIIQKSALRLNIKSNIEKNLKILSFGFLIPFFFINIGVNFDFSAIVSNPWLVSTIVIVAILGKIGGTFAAKPISGLSWQQLHLIGWGMNSRGVMELVIVSIALNAGLITHDLYSAVVFMAVITTAIFPFVIKYLIRKHPKIMD